MKQRIRYGLSILLVLAMTLSLLPVSVLAEEPESTSTTVTEPAEVPTPADSSDQEETDSDSEPVSATTVYVSEDGSDTEGNGTKTSPYGTLAKAIGCVEENGTATIFLQSDLTLTTSVRYWDGKDITIASDPEQGKVYTISRAESGFLPVQDPARGGYNGAMMEVGNGADLTLTNIILDDGGYAAYTIDPDVGTVSGTPYYVQVDASRGGNPEGEPQPGETEINGKDVSNHKIVQDAILASYDSSSVITLGDGAVLQNYGGMSAVRASGATLIMESGSKICDTMDLTRTKGALGSYGPAGAVWVQSGTFQMEDGAEICDMNGRAVYMDSGDAVIDGEIHGITHNGNMWQKADGVAVHVRGGASVEFNGVISEISKSGSAVFVVGGSFYMNEGSVITNCQGITAINEYGELGGYVLMAGTITGNTGGQALNINANIWETDEILLCDLKGEITHNTYNGANGIIYLQGYGATLNIWGKINDNVGSGHVGLWIGSHFCGSAVNMYDGAEIKNNVSESAWASGLSIANGTFTMYGGTISGNYAGSGCSGVSVGDSGVFIMEGGTISDNVTKGSAGGVHFASTYNGEALNKNYPAEDPVAQLKGGEIYGNLANADFSIDDAGAVVLNGGESRDISIAGAVNGDVNNEGKPAIPNGYSCIDRYMTIEDGMSIGNENVYLGKYDLTLTNPGTGVKFGNASIAALDEILDSLTEKGFSGPELASLWVYSEEPIAELELSKPQATNNSLPIYAAAIPMGEEDEAEDGASVQYYAVTEQDGMLKVAVPSDHAKGYAVALVQPTQDFGTMTLTAPSVLAGTTDQKGSYSIDYTAAYDFSQTLKTILETGGTLSDITFEIQVDPKLVVDINRVVFDSQIFENVSTTYYGYGLLSITAKVKDGWQNAADWKTTIRFPAELAQEDFVAGAVLYANGQVTAQVTSGGTPVSIYVPSNATATQLQLNVVITAMAGSYGSITPDGEVNVPYGGDQTFQIAADPGCSIRDVIVDGVSQGAIRSYTFENVTESHTIEAYFSKDSSGGGVSRSYTLRYDTNGGEKLESETKDRIWTKDYENLPTPVRTGYVFDGWYYDSKLTDLVEEDVEVNQSTMTLYAKWSKDPKDPDNNGVSDWLETDQHNAYLSGYPDGSFGADRSITRAEVAQMFYALLKDKQVSAAKTFSDVSADAWYADAVNTMAALGMMGGYPDGTFHPDAPITRAEFATVALAFADDPINPSCSYTDVKPGSWYYTYVAKATAYGWVGGYYDGSFRPNNSITRSEVCVIVNNMLGRSADEDYIDRNQNELVSFTDLSSRYWGYYAIMEATNSHAYTCDSEGEAWDAVK